MIIKSFFIYKNITITCHKIHTTATPISTKINAPIPSAVPMPAIHANISLPSLVKIKIYKKTTVKPIANSILIAIHKATAVI